MEETIRYRRLQPSLQRIHRLRRRPSQHQVLTQAQVQLQILALHNGRYVENYRRHLELKCGHERYFFLFLQQHLSY